MKNSKNASQREVVIFSPKTPIELSYLAGYFDGEGCVCVAGNNTHGLGISVKTADKSVIERFVKAFGGSLQVILRKNPKYRQMYTWSATNGAAQHILRKLIPYLDAKKLQAEWATLPRYKYNGLTAPIPEDERTVRTLVYNCVKAQKWQIHGQS